MALSTDILSLIPNGYYSAIASAESGNSNAAKNPNSSATGKYQFTTGTWNDLMTMHPELGLTANGRSDDAQQEKAVRALTQDNAQALAASNINVTPANLYAAHFLGADGAEAVLSQPTDTPVSKLVSPDVLKANPFLSKMTVGDFQNWTAQKVGTPTAASGSANITSSAPTNQLASAAFPYGGLTLPTQAATGTGIGMNPNALMALSLASRLQSQPQQAQAYQMPTAQVQNPMGSNALAQMAQNRYQPQFIVPSSQPSNYLMNGVLAS